MGAFARRRFHRARVAHARVRHRMGRAHGESLPLRAGTARVPLRPAFLTSLASVPDRCAIHQTGNNHMSGLRTCLLICLWLLPGLPGAARELHAVRDGACDGYPRLAIATMRGMCAGLVLGPTTQDPSRPLRLPRSLLQLDAGTWLVTALGAWDGTRGAVWRLRVAAGQPVQAQRLLEGLHLPHAIALGPDGRV